MSARISIITHYQKHKNPRPVRVNVRNKMQQTTEELLAEIQRLRNEIQQLREMVNALFNAVFEDLEEDWDTLPHREDYNMYN